MAAGIENGWGLVRRPTAAAGVSRAGVVMQR
jgi:hypothetical protein